MGAYERRKGHDFEREVARKLRMALHLDERAVRRGMQFVDGAHAPDVVTPIVAIECKCGANPPLWSAMQQAVDACSSGQYPAVALKRDRTPPVVAMLLDDWIDLLGAYWALSQR